MRTILAASLAAMLMFASAPGRACDDHHGQCEVEDWRWNAVPGTDFVMIDGVATCDKGEVALRLYEGDGGKFLGVDTAYIEQHVFQSILTGVQNPSDIAIKYSIKPGS